MEGWLARIGALGVAALATVPACGADGQHSAGGAEPSVVVIRERDAAAPPVGEDAREPAPRAVPLPELNFVDRKSTRLNSSH